MNERCITLNLGLGMQLSTFADELNSSWNKLGLVNVNVIMKLRTNSDIKIYLVVSYSMQFVR